MSDTHKYQKYKTKYLNLSKCINVLQGGGFSNKEIYIVRHGQTLWNQLGKTQGQESDLPLNEEGIRESVFTGKYFNDYRTNDEKFDCIVCSPQLRCRQTADIICDELKFKKTDITIMDDLKEVKKGNMSGITQQHDRNISFHAFVKSALEKIIDPIERYEIQNPHNTKAFNDKIVNDNNLDISGGETTEELIGRLNNIIEFIKTTEHKKIMIVTHSGILLSLLKIIFNINVLPKYTMTNCCICYCTYINDVFHMVSPINSEHMAIYE